MQIKPFGSAEPEGFFVVWGISLKLPIQQNNAPRGVNTPLKWKMSPYGDQERCETFVSSPSGLRDRA